MLLLFSIALFSGAVLSFIVQPMVAKMVLPQFGGAPAVWNTCVLFFQAALLAGYAYAHWAPRFLGLRRQAFVHLLLMVLAAALLPITISTAWGPPSESWPALWLLWLLLVSVGLPFLVVSATAPLLQHWFAATKHASAKDPYFLYVASNLGSMLALLSYPFLLEPALTLEQQSWAWLILYGVLIGLVLICAVLLWRSGKENHATDGVLVPHAPAKESHKPEAPAKESHKPEAPAKESHKPEAPAKDSAIPSLAPQACTPERKPDKVIKPEVPALSGPTWKDRLRWLALSFVPSSLMLSVTTYLTTDIAAIPLFWVTPLAIYLLTFILAFARKPPIPHWLVQRLMPVLVLLLTLVYLSEAPEPIGLLMFLHLTGLFLVALACHGELARSRPSVEHLTEFYLWLSLGGVLGGVFNALLAPVLFVTVLEYPIALVMACLLRHPVGFEEHKPDAPAKGKNKPDAPAKGKNKPDAPAKGRPRPSLALQAYTGPGIPDKVLGGFLLSKTFWLKDALPAAVLGLVTIILVFAARSYLKPDEPASFQLMVGLAFGFPAIVCYTFVERPLRYGLGIAALFLAGQFTEGIYGQRIYADRGFFGILRITRDPDGHFLKLIHGSTIHGQQSTNPGERLEPLTYYHRSGPIGKMFAALEKHDIPLQEVAVIGLGVGSLAAYGQKGQNWTFYEIDPLVVKIARDLNYFTYWKDSQANLSVVLGDARLKLKEAEGKQYDLLIVDAFNSDSVPVHLLTREALQVCLSRLKENGVLAFHISNRNLNLEPVLGALAGDAGLPCLKWSDTVVNDEDKKKGKLPSQWVVLGRANSPLDQIKDGGNWQPCPPGDPRYLWTDDFSNIFQVFRWGGE